MFSKACEYGIKAATYVALQSIGNRRVSLKEIAENTDSPVAFTAKVLHQLAKNGILDSLKGPTGGFQIEQPRIKTIMLEEIVAAIDGSSIYEGCALGFSQCNAKRPCPLHFQFVGIRDDLKEMLQTTSLHDLATGLKDGKVFLR